MKENNKLSTVFDLVHKSIQEQYKSYQLNVDDIINRNKNESIQNHKNEYIYERLVKSIHNANWKVVSQQTFWGQHEQNYEKELVLC